MACARRGSGPAAVSVLLTAAAVEGVLRLADYAPERYRNTARVVDARWRALLDCYQTNPRGYFDLDLRVPEVRERYRWMAPVRIDAVARRARWAVESRYNSRRMRDVELGPKRPGVHRVLVVGDSFTEGQGVREDDPTGELGPWDSRLAQLVADDWRAWRIGRETMRWYRDMYDAPNRDGWVVTQELIRRMQRQTREARARFILQSWPLLVSLNRYPFAGVGETIAGFCAASRIERVDLRPVFRGRSTEELWVHPIDRHPNQVAHRLAAERLRDVLLRRPR